MLTDQLRKLVRSSFPFAAEDLAEALVCGSGCSLVNKYSSFPIPSRHSTRYIKKHSNFEVVEILVTEASFMDIDTQPCLAVTLCGIVYPQTNHARTKDRAVTIENQFSLYMPGWKF